MWTKEITDMIVSGVWATLYMTLASTILGYVFGLPMGVLLAITDKEGLTPNAIVYKILDVIANIVQKYPVPDSSYFAYSIYKADRWTKLWFYSNRCTTCDRSNPVYCPNGGIFY